MKQWQCHSVLTAQKTIKTNHLQMRKGTYCSTIFFGAADEVLYSKSEIYFWIHFVIFVNFTYMQIYVKKLE